MEIIIILVSILQSISISLGVGSSTLAITNFFVAIADGTIDPVEKKMMKVTYIVLRVAMVLILLTTLILTLTGYYNFSHTTIAPYGMTLYVLIAMLYINAILMTKRIMPRTLGPALQVSAWYTLGVVNALLPLGLVSFSIVHFLLAYAAVILLAVAIVNAGMAYFKPHNEATHVS
jgi:hypothetical protein